MKPVNIDPIAIEEVISRGVSDCVQGEHLRKRMLSGDRLRIKFGIDPTSPHMHLGHTVPLLKLRQFQELGHQAVLIIGDATAMIGDPTGRSETRNKLTRTEIEKNKKTYIDQAAKVLHIEDVEIHHNGEWFHEMSAAEFLGLTSLVTVQQVLQREDFRKRVEDVDHPLTAIELAYPVMQGYDSVMVKADVEIGGHDQLLNLLFGRRMQRHFQQEEQDVLTVPLLEGTDGERKMSKSFGNAISLTAEPNDMFGKIMTIPDGLVIKYFLLLTDVSAGDIEQHERRLADGENPRNVKADLGWAIVRMYHGASAADGARAAFDAQFKGGAMPDEIPSLKTVGGSVVLLDAVASGFGISRSEARRKIEEGGVSIDGRQEKELMTSVDAESVIKLGRRYIRIVHG